MRPFQTRADSRSVLRACRHCGVCLVHSATQHASGQGIRIFVCGEFFKGNFQETRTFEIHAFARIGQRGELAVEIEEVECDSQVGQQCGCTSKTISADFLGIQCIGKGARLAADMPEFNQAARAVAGQLPVLLDVEPVAGGDRRRSRFRRIGPSCFPCEKQTKRQPLGAAWRRL